MIIRLLFLYLLTFSHVSISSGITSLKLSTAQIFDVQWNISGGRLNASGFNYIYGSVNYATQTNSAARWTAAQTADASANGRYIGFFNSSTNPGTYGMAVFNSDGTRYKTINNTGSFRALADGAIFYNGNGMWGTLITTGQGYNYGQSGSWAVTQNYPTNPQLQAYTPPSSTPLAAGQTAQPAAPPPPPALAGGATATAFDPNTANTTKVNAFVARTTADSRVMIEQIGNFNVATVRQSGTRNNSVDLAVTGSNNTTIVTQFGTATTTANFSEIDVLGNNNNINVTQTSTGGSKGAHITVNNNNNTVVLRQRDAGSHSAELTLTGGNKSVDITQQGSAAHRASVSLSGQPINLNLTQSGTTQQFYSITHTCATTGGCAAITVTQGQ